MSPGRSGGAAALGAASGGDSERRRGGGAANGTLRYTVGERAPEGEREQNLNFRSNEYCAFQGCNGDLKKL